jgi:hypothetical protein
MRIMTANRFEVGGGCGADTSGVPMVKMKRIGAAEPEWMTPKEARALAELLLDQARYAEHAAAGFPE